VLSEAVLYKILLDTKGTATFPTIADRGAWAAVRTHPVAELALRQAPAVVTEPVPYLSATMYLDCSRTGRRTWWQKPGHERRIRLGLLTLAECLENEGKYLDAIVDLMWAICEESTWVAPAHAPEAPLPDVTNPGIDLYAAGTGISLAEMDYLLGDKLPPVVRKRIRREAHVRLIEPYLRRMDFKWLGGTGHANNWNAVCSCGVLATALQLCDDTMVQARVMAKAIAHSPAYLTSFDEDGCTSEGAGYWGYGFGHYAMMAQMIEARTEGRVEMLAGEKFRRICQFPPRVELSPGTFVTFSDCDEHAHVPAGACAWLARKLDVPELGAFARRFLDLLERDKQMRPCNLLRALFWVDPAAPATAPLEATTWFDGFQWLISRFAPAAADGLVLAVKGGHNAEDHNHNDVGSYIVHVGGESLIVDPQRPTYTLQFFGPKRYEFLETRSGGHCVPVLNGVEQAAGREYEAVVLGKRFTAVADEVEYELAGAYPAVAGITSLRRSVTLNRTGPKGEVVVTDRFQFADGEPGEYESRIHTLGTVAQVAPGILLLQGQKAAVRVVYDAAYVSLTTEEIQPGENSTWSPVLTRLRFARRSAEGSFTLRIIPE